MESDRLLSDRENGSSGTAGINSKSQRNQTISTWALVIAVTFLAAVLVVDIHLRRSDGANGIRAPAASTDASTVTTTSSLSTADTSDSASRYHATQFMSFTINTLGGLAEHGECEGRNVDPKSDSCYLGNDDIGEDLNHRLAILEEVLYILRQVFFLLDKCVIGTTSLTNNQLCLKLLQK